ncbi:hypothetical protein [Spiroplasma culicicola]|uniref:Transmembrane protein n=1 Tax=Spiroplasma culicicola AES-1 TaxID=1276246 RepID=W6A610_9MOLU|nr:hypothetical protein [Spiroplasma culicicola]AHI52432.1 hypothetical protein SCULI_v1c00910 [Spiroplasma culicicola AES-1]
MRGLKRLLRVLINTGLTFITFGIYGIVMFIWWARGNADLGMKVIGVDFSNSDKSGQLWMMQFLVGFCWVLTFGIMWVIDIVFLCSGNDSFAERWSGCSME